MGTHIGRDQHMTLQSICVYLGSNLGNRPDYKKACLALADELTKRKMRLVYGGAKVGLMGELADHMMANGGRVMGIIPRALQDKEIAHDGLTDLKLVSSMHERKTLMAREADAFIALPGGVGTLEEIFEVWTWAQLGDHQKPIGFLNVAGFYDKLLTFLDYQRDEGFVKPEMRAMALVEKTPAALLDAFIAYQPQNVSKWIGAAQR